MEWLFGSIKKSSKPEVYVSNVVEGDFNVVSSSQEPARPPYPLYPTLATSHGYTQSPYPPTYSGYPPQQPHYSQQYQRPPYVQQSSSAAPANKPVNPLDSIPFKISSYLDSKSLPVSEYQLKSIKNQLDNVSNRINSDSYNYSFELERKT